MKDSGRGHWPLERQRAVFLLASGLSTAGSFAGLTAKGWILLQDTQNPLLLALHFAALALPALVVSGPAGVRTDRLGCETVLIQAQWGLVVGGAIGALAIPLLEDQAQVLALLLSTLVVGIASSYELTARNKYCALLVEDPEELASYLTSFSVVFNVGKLVGPPLGGWLVMLSGPALALAIDASTYVLPIITLIWLLQPLRRNEQRSAVAKASLGQAWRDCGATLRHVLLFTSLSCLAGFFHPGLAPLLAVRVVGPSPQDLGLFTSVLAAGSIAAGLVLQRHSRWISERPALLMGVCTLITGLAQLGMASSTQRLPGLAMSFLIGAGTASLLAGTNLIAQVGAPMELRGRMAGLAQIAFLGGGGLSGLLAAQLTGMVGMTLTLALLGGVGVVLGLDELLRRGGMRLRSAGYP